MNSLLRKTAMGGGGRTLLALALISMLFLSATVHSFAIKAGDTVSYSATEEDGNYVNFKVTSGGKEYSGTCIQFGSSPSSGTAKLGTPSLKMKKIAYYYGDVLGYKGSSANGGHVLGRDGALYSEGAVLMYMLQAESQGYDNWKAISEATGWIMLDERSCNAVINKIAGTDWDSIQLPSDFQMLTLECGNDQDGCIWYYEAAGKLKLKKASSNSSITG